MLVRSYTVLHPPSLCHMSGLEIMLVGACLSIYLCVSNKHVGEETTALARGSSLPAATLKNHCGVYCTTTEPLKQQHAYSETYNAVRVE